MQEQRFIGVYASSEMPSTLGASHRPMVRRKRLWFVWETGDGKYQVQPLNAVHMPMAEPRLITAKEFETRFTAEAECCAAPAGCAPDGEQQEQPPQMPEGDMPGESGGQDAPQVLRADDPNLLQMWLEGRAPVPPRQEGLTPAQEAEMTRLLEDALLDPSRESAANASGVAEAGETWDAATKSDPAEERDPEQALRADFALALLQLKQGRRSDGVAGLERMLSRPYAPFASAATIFSELGLSLRRLGLINLSLLAHQRALEFAPEDERVHFNLARSFHDLNKFSTARMHLERALAIAPDFTVARQFLVFLKAKDPAPLADGKE